MVARAMTAGYWLFGLTAFYQVEESHYFGFF